MQFIKLRDGESAVYVPSEEECKKMEEDDIYNLAERALQYLAQENMACLIIGILGINEEAKKIVMDEFGKEL